MITDFTIYVKYLVCVAKEQCRPFALPKNRKSLDERNDCHFFTALERLMNKYKINTPHEAERFLDTARQYLTNGFHVSNIVTEFDVIYKKFEENSVKKEENKSKLVKKSFGVLLRYCHDNDLKYEDLFVGNPSRILKLWKGGNIHDVVVVHLCDLDKMKKKSWFKIYCGDLSFNMKKIKDDILNDSELCKLLSSETVTLKKMVESIEK